jgi:putative DNA primase/helicase
VPEDKRFHEQLLKDMTGGDTIKTRRLYENEWEYEPTFKLFFCGNHKPVIKGADGGIWRRVRLIPWTVIIPASERDSELEEKLKAELPGILAWAVRGCAAWQEHGLGLPPDVERATADYREESDPLADFFRTRCEFGEGLKVTRVALRRAYEAWCQQQGAMPFGHKKFGEALRRRGVVDGGTAWDSLASTPVDAWRGVRLRGQAA